jgi:hypothetical protein
MKSVTYTGGCATLYEFGHKFTVARRSVTLSDEEAKVFEGLPEYRIIDVPDLTANVTGGGQEGSGAGQNDGQGENGQQNDGQGENGQQNDSQGENDDNEQDALKKKLKRLTAEQLQQMCTEKGLDATGTKDELVDRIVNA